jgi:hypothetical protein
MMLSVMGALTFKLVTLEGRDANLVKGFKPLHQGTKNPHQAFDAEMKAKVFAHAATNLWQ